MLNTKPHIVTRGVGGETMTLVFYPDTGCLRFSDVAGMCHELRPPHSWFAISSVTRGVCRGAHALTEGLNTLLREFCARRPRWMSGPARLAAAGLLAQCDLDAALVPLAQRELNAPAAPAGVAGSATPVARLTARLTAPVARLTEQAAHSVQSTQAASVP